MRKIVEIEQIRPEPTEPPYNENQESKPKVVSKPILAYPVTVQQMSADAGNLQEYKEFVWHSVHMLDLKTLKEAVNSYGIHSPFIKQILNSREFKTE